jgi:hypothetical protein
MAPSRKLSTRFVRRDGTSAARASCQKLTRPLRTTDGGTLRTVLDARAYIVSLLKRRELRGQWQDVGELTKALELALFFDSKLDLTVIGVGAVSGSLLKCASVSRSSGKRRDDDYDRAGRAAVDFWIAVFSICPTLAASAIAINPSRCFMPPSIP